MNSIDPDALPADLKIFFLQIITSLIEQANERQIKEEIIPEIIEM